ncbi:MAG: ABC transporter ATP-binding protein [Anaerolineae bacterium]|nr:ABC transporter ATP-binding protein [Anaerolineae bacterium]
MNSDTAFVTDGLTRHFGEVVAVDHLTLEVRAGEVFGFLGHNGAGKTTTVRMLNGVLAPTSGTARVLGLTPMEQGTALRRRTGVLTETPSLDERLTGRENLEIYAALYGVPRREIAARVTELMEVFQLDGRADEKAGDYSKGMKQRLALARALVHRPQLLFLDEPTSGLDPVAARLVHDMITHLSRDEERTVFLCTHNLIEAQKLCDRVAILEHGKLVALGTPAELACKVGRSQRLELQVAPGDEETVFRLLAEAPGVSAHRENGTIVAAGAEWAAIPGMVTSLASAGVHIYRVAPQEASLEDAYFALQREKEEMS